MRSALAAVLVVLLLTPALAAAQSSPFQPLPSAPQETAPPVTSTSADDGGVSSLQQTLLIGAGILFVLGIGFAIAWDARRNAPGADRPGARPLPKDEREEAVGERKKRDPRSQAKQKAAAKRAREARKRNRPVRK